MSCSQCAREASHSSWHCAGHLQDPQHKEASPPHLPTGPPCNLCANIHVALTLQLVTINLVFKVWASSRGIPIVVGGNIMQAIMTRRGLMKQTAFEPSYTAITKDGAEWIVRQGSIKLVGLDYLSVAHYADLIGPHVALLGQVRAPPLRLLPPVMLPRAPVSEQSMHRLHSFRSTPCLLLAAWATHFKSRAC